MRRSFLFLAGFALVGLVILSRVVSASGSGSCTIRGFEAVVRRGPTQGMLLSGTLRLQSDYYGALSGWLNSVDGQFSIKVTGEVNGAALNLIFDLGYSGRTKTSILGTGTLSHAFPDCSGATGGLLVGPQAGDSGDWSIQDAQASGN